MSRLRTLIFDQRGTAAAEMALVTPLLLILMFGLVEVGSYFYNQHILVKSVRDGARFAARQGFDNFQTCGATPTGTVEADTKQVTRTGRISGGGDRLANWTNASTTFSVTTLCSTGNGTVTYAGLYSSFSSGGARIVQVSATLPYRPIIGMFGLKATFTLKASQQAAVAGI
jgi:Flp pilus assembly protein TadG